MTKKKSGKRGKQRGSDAQTELDDGAEFSLAPSQAPGGSEVSTKARGKAPSKPASRRKADDANILSYRHTDTRKNNPHVGLVSPESDPEQQATTWAYDPHIDPALQFDVGRAEIERLIDDALASGDANVMRGALEELKRRSEPYLNWTGKAERTSFEVDTVSLYVHERIDPASILAGVRKRLRESKGGGGAQPDLFAAPFENLPLRDAIDFYKHERGWANRLIAGDSLLVMNSLLQKESMAGQVQMIYIDPPYGIKYGSNFQPFVNKRDVRDRKDEDLTQEPEMIKAFRDTWELGIHSYLTYLRDRLLVAKELLNESGSIFVQIGEESVHRVREVLDETFGAENAIATIVYKSAVGLGSEFIDTIATYLLLYAKNPQKFKFRKLFSELILGEEGATRYLLAESPDGRIRRLGPGDDDDEAQLVHEDVRPFFKQGITSRTGGESTLFPVEFLGGTYRPTTGGWRTGSAGMSTLKRAGRVTIEGNRLTFKRYFDDFTATPLTNIWDAISGGIKSRSDPKIYAVQTSTTVIERCLLMTTEPGDLVLDPTCGSGTTAFVAEKWGRRWITCDTSRVAITLAKQRLMTAGYDYCELRYPHEGLRGGFIYDTVPHVTLKSIANNPDIDEIFERMHPAIDETREQLNAALTKQPPAQAHEVIEGARKGESLDFRKGAKLEEWEVPFDFPDAWPESAKAPFAAFHAARQAMQKKMDASIAAHAEQEILYDRPAVSKDKLRITGPFTVEAVPFPTVLALEEAQQPKEADVAIARSGESARQHAWRDELLKTGIRGKGGQILKFAALEALPDTRHLNVTGTLADTGERVVVCFGPAHGALEQRRVAMALNETEKLRPTPKFVVFCAFTFDPEAAKDIDEIKWPGTTLLKVQMNTDLLTEDLKKARASNQSFWLMGQPDVDVRQRKDGRWEVEVNGFDYFDTIKGELVSGGKGKIAAWLLDTDYDERSLYPRQVFFPMAGAKDGWNKLRRDIRAELNEGLLEKFHGTVSLPFEAGENRKVAVKIVDDRGIESLKIVPLD